MTSSSSSSSSLLSSSLSSSSSSSFYQIQDKHVAADVIKEMRLLLKKQSEVSLTAFDGMVQTATQRRSLLTRDVIAANSNNMIIPTDEEDDDDTLFYQSIIKENKVPIRPRQITQKPILEPIGDESRKPAPLSVIASLSNTKPHAISPISSGRDEDSKYTLKPVQVRDQGKAGRKMPKLAYSSSLLVKNRKSKPIL